MAHVLMRASSHTASSRPSLLMCTDARLALMQAAHTSPEFAVMTGLHMGMILHKKPLWHLSTSMTAKKMSTIRKGMGLTLHQLSLLMNPSRRPTLPERQLHMQKKESSDNLHHHSSRSWLAVASSQSYSRGMSCLPLSPAIAATPYWGAVAMHSRCRFSAAFTGTGPAFSTPNAISPNLWKKKGPSSLISALLEMSSCSTMLSCDGMRSQMQTAAFGVPTSFTSIIDIKLQG